MKEQSELHIPLTEKLKSIPEVFGIRFNEEPPYEVLKKDGHFEVRRYQKQLMARVALKGLKYDDFRETAFKKLAHYIFGGNVQKQEMPMTSPVLNQEMAMTSPSLSQQHSEGNWTMSFILPSKYNLSNVPQPLDSEVKLLEIPPYDAASVRYAGTNSIESVKSHEAQLNSWIETQPQLNAEEDFFTAQYDGPFAIPFLRRNEILVKVHLRN